MGTASGAWIAHLYTALGAGTALAATLAVFAGEFRQAFLWLARGGVHRLDRRGAGPRGATSRSGCRGFDGETLDNVVDYLTYVFVPVLIMLRAGLWPADVAVGLGVAVLVASGYGFSRTDAKVDTIDYAFTGFPSYWNIVALYLYAWRLPPAANAAVVAVLVALVFVPIRYVYPSRTRTWQPATLALGAAWAVLTAVVCGGCRPSTGRGWSCRWCSRPTTPSCRCG